MRKYISKVKDFKVGNLKNVDEITKLIKLFSLFFTKSENGQQRHVMMHLDEMMENSYYIEYQLDNMFEITQIYEDIILQELQIPKQGMIRRIQTIYGTNIFLKPQKRTNSIDGVITEEDSNDFQSSFFSDEKSLKVRSRLDTIRKMAED